MALKISTIANDERTAWPPAMACTPFDGRAEWLGDSAESLLQEAINCFGMGSPHLRGRADVVATDNYQIALIPLPNRTNQSDGDASVLAGMSSVFVLPLTWNDLVKRLRAEAGSSRSGQSNDVVAFGAISVKLSSMEVRRSGKRVTVTPLEFKLLRYLIMHPAQVLSRDELLNEVWGFDNYPCTRTVDSHMWRLRRKLEADPSKPVHFHTVHAIGYKFVP